MTRTIIIPLSDPRQDEEGIAEQAIICTHMLVGTYDARVLLVSVIDDEASRAERQAYLDHIAGTIGEDVETRIELGEPASKILAIAAQVQDPIIMMASHGRRGAELRVLGSVAASVARGASCPVLILPASRMIQAPICNRIERVLLPMNDPAIADEQDIDLIVMPAHSRRGFNSLVPDIFAAQLRTPEPVPVLLVHPEIAA